MFQVLTSPLSRAALGGLLIVAFSSLVVDLASAQQVAMRQSATAAPDEETTAQDAIAPTRPNSYADYAPWLEETGLPIVDYHIHIRGGMTPELALERARKTGVKSGVLENAGRDWPLSTNEKIAEFIDSVAALNEKLAPAERLRVGLQVNDRDWYIKIPQKLYRRLDFILADTMIMGVDATGQPQKLWLLPENYRTDKDMWFRRYFNHCLNVVGEPIDVLANVTYLPEFIKDDYDKYWTESRMRTLIQAAIDNDVALEIQAESEFPKPKFIKLALEMGAKLSFGSNNFDASLHDLTAWKRAIDDCNITAASLWQDFSMRDGKFDSARAASIMAPR
ncbi:MAG: hypothetical protein HUK22_03990, partial [Thermoguttaceae bacterium]|nr:hypothetical protein [Thermoguttaceae bacterium]